MRDKRDREKEGTQAKSPQREQSPRSAATGGGDAGKGPAGKESGPEPREGIERRRKKEFRSLIDEMMKQLREASNRDIWTPEERAQAERDLERIMNSVRSEALKKSES